MATTQFQKIVTADKNLQLVQQNIQNALGPIQASIFQNGNFLSAVSIGSSQTQVAHQLKRIPQGFIIAGLNANSVVWSSQASDSSFLYLTGSSACMVNLWVF